MKALLYSLTLLLFSLGVEAADRSQLATAVQSVGVESLVLHSAPEPAACCGLDNSVLPVAVSGVATGYRLLPESLPPFFAPSASKTRSSIRAPPAALS
ncbi:hypothetical protein GCM10011348_23150 [Marinobacterium nitratireducens]|uniref:Secreted protein n=1 Tax=Marinobacterium nitratireducens TaxID=518897 RepID=A0A917ZFN2_9GAMM|nr:hypothetical protein [Marinobacterium nitratireducens]GGO82236.1 hypothetical protein GCM10011348_23150 [Marinobacterium nitratireducens]